MAKEKEYTAVGLPERFEPSNTSLATDDGEIDKTKKQQACKEKLISAIHSFIPITYWLPRYKWVEWFPGDLVAGITMGIIMVPQGMAYASLASLPPVVGMYSSFFAAIAYMFLGTSRHISVGVFAVASMMVASCRLRFIPEVDPLSTQNVTMPLGETTPIELTAALTLCVGLVQFIMGLLRLGFLTTYLSDSLISGFTTGCAAHIFVSQINKIIGIRLPRHEGIGMLIKMIRDMILALPQTNWMAVVISVFAISFILIGRDYVNPWFKKFSRVPIPLELILVMIGSAFSSQMGLSENYGIRIVNTIPRGFPAPSLPRVDLFPILISDAIPIAVVCYMFVMSMAKLFAKKHKYRIDPTQELFACGGMSVLSSFFPVYPVGASLSRSVVCEMSGANTMFYTVFSSTLLFTVIMFLGPFLEPLPKCILACIVLVTLRSLFKQANQLPYLWKVSKPDFTVWLVSCMSTVFTDVPTGLIISVAYALLSVVLREQWPNCKFIQHSPAVPQHCPEDIQVFRFDSPLHFVNVDTFLSALSDTINTNADALLGHSALVIDCTAMAYIDSMGVDAIREVYLDGKKNGVRVAFAGLNDRTLKVLKRIDFHSKVPQNAFSINVDEAIRQIVNSKELVKQSSLN